MTITRITHKQKIYEDPDHPDTSSWIEVERTDELIVETGRGHDYQKTKFKFNWPKDSNGNDDESNTQNRKVSQINISIDGGGSIPLNIIDEIPVEVGRGHDYQKTKYKFDNTAANSKRKTHVKTITSSSGSGKVDVEIIDEWTHEQGRGHDYQSTKFKPNWPEGAGQ
jgi:hypothetical protein